MVTQRCMYNTFTEQNLYYYGLSGSHEAPPPVAPHLACVPVKPCNFLVAKFILYLHQAIAQLYV